MALTSSVCLSAASRDACATWCEAVRQCIEHVVAPACSRCKPKLIVNPMPLSSNSTTATTSNDQADHKFLAESALLHPISTQHQQQQQQQHQHHITNDEEMNVDLVPSRGVRDESAELAAKLRLMEQVQAASESEHEMRYAAACARVDEADGARARCEQELACMSKRLAQANGACEAGLAHIRMLDERLALACLQTRDKQAECEQLSQRVDELERQLARANMVSHLLLI